MSEISEKIGSLQATAKAAHHRIDRLESEIKSDLTTLNTELKHLNAYMNKSKGWMSAIVLLSSAAGGAMLKLAELIFFK